MANVLGCDIVVSEFEIQLPYYVHFQTNTLQKGMNPVILPSFVPLLGWLWHSMTYEGWYAIKERNWNLLCMDVQSDIMFRKKTRQNEFEIWKWLFSFKISTRMLFKKARSPFFLLTCSLSLSLFLSLQDMLKASHHWQEMVCKAELVNEALYQSWETSWICSLVKAQNLVRLCEI